MQHDYEHTLFEAFNAILFRDRRATWNNLRLNLKLKEKLEEV